MPFVALPAHHTKHLKALEYPFNNTQFSLRQQDSGESNGTALWLGAQCLSLYLIDVCSRRRPRRALANINGARRPRAIELGAGIGLSGLALASLGFDVLCTDVPVVLPLLHENIAHNALNLPSSSGIIQVRELDWTTPPEQWLWDDPRVIASPRARECTSPAPGDETSATDPEFFLAPPFDLIITADTLYSPELVDPLLRTLRALIVVSTTPERSPQSFLALERRDPALIDGALAAASEKWGMVCKRVAHRRLAKALEKGGTTWPREDWEGVEVWEIALSPATAAHNPI